MTQTRLLSTSEVADRVGLSTKAIYRAIDRGELRASKLCGRIRVDPDDLDAWIEESRVEPIAIRTDPPVHGSQGCASTGLRALLREA
jgi:excisionase family DNA binding protein